MHIPTDSAEYFGTFRKDREEHFALHMGVRVLPKENSSCPGHKHTFEESMIHANAHLFGKKNKFART